MEYYYAWCQFRKAICDMATSEEDLRHRLADAWTYDFAKLLEGDFPRPCFDDVKQLQKFGEKISNSSLSDADAREMAKLIVKIEGDICHKVLDELEKSA